MIGILRGKLLKKAPDRIIIDVGGVGYVVHISLITFEKLRNIDSEILLHTHTVLKEDSLQLYGFLSEDEKDIFCTLLNVNGIGPKTALNILSYLEPDDLKKAIEEEDLKKLTKIPGLGKKTAQRLLLELRDKLPDKMKREDPLLSDAVSALMNLGYQKSEAKDAVERAQKKARTFEDIIKEALKLLTGQD
ncbi:MAG: Holliday junction branch migration protein RuvA [Thermodesulfovibrionales bacterium]|nr:Holliday junction branch migration protein RuvA [Thermodesulfovibrionales bacterium]